MRVALEILFNLRIYCKYLSNLATFAEEKVWSKLSVAALPAEEKDKLYKAIDYNESVRVKYPTEVSAEINNKLSVFIPIDIITIRNHITIPVDSVSDYEHGYKRICSLKLV